MHRIKSVLAVNFMASHSHCLFLLIYERATVAITHARTRDDVLLILHCCLPARVPSMLDCFKRMQGSGLWVPAGPRTLGYFCRPKAIYHS